jgi:hypothetical protein
VTVSTVVNPLQRGLNSQIKIQVERAELTNYMGADRAELTN